MRKVRGHSQHTKRTGGPPQYRYHLLTGAVTAFRAWPTTHIARLPKKVADCRDVQQQGAADGGAEGAVGARVEWEAVQDELRDFADSHLFVSGPSDTVTVAQVRNYLALRIQLTEIIIIPQVRMASQRMRPDLLPGCNCQAWCVWRWPRLYRLCLLALLGCRTNQKFTFCSPFIGTALDFLKSNGHAQSTQQGQFCSQSDSWQDKHRSNTQNLSGSGNVTVLICIDIVSHSSLQLGQPKPDLFPMLANKMPT